MVSHIFCPLSIVNWFWDTTTGATLTNNPRKMTPDVWAAQIWNDCPGVRRLPPPSQTLFSSCPGAAGSDLGADQWYLLRSYTDVVCWNKHMWRGFLILSQDHCSIRNPKFLDVKSRKAPERWAAGLCCPSPQQGLCPLPGSQYLLGAPRSPPCLKIATE